LHFESIAASSWGLAGTVPIAGKVQLEGLILFAGSTHVAEDPHMVQLALGTEIPATQAALLGEEQLFPRASQAVGAMSGFPVNAYYAMLFVPVTTVVSFNGRRLLGGFYNGNGVSAMDGYVGVLMHRIYGGSSSGDPAFLSGEEVVDT
jgi:hypothetical protein